MATIGVVEFQVGGSLYALDIHLAQEIVARSKAPATSQLRRKGVGILLTGLGMVAAAILGVALGAHHGFGGRLLWLFILGIGTAIYGIFQIVFG